MENRGRGRPIGSGLGKQSGFSNYKPARWHPEFDLIILESINGNSNETIAEKYGYTKQHISNILSTEEARKVKERIRGTIEEEGKRCFKERIASIGEKALEHVEKFILDDAGLAERQPFMFLDRALKIGSSVGVMNSGSEKQSGSNGPMQQINVAGNAIIMNNEKADALKNALNDSMELEYVEVKKVG